VPTLNYEVYWNIRLKCWSVRMNRKVIGHYSQLFLQQCTFHVSERGRQRVLRERRKNVHAVVRGSMLSWQAHERVEQDMLTGGLGVPWDCPGETVTYNPYRGPDFTTADGIAVKSAQFVLFRKDGKLKANVITTALPASNAA
jgi:hypothetical protein